MWGNPGRTEPEPSKTSSPAQLWVLSKRVTGLGPVPASVFLLFFLFSPLLAALLLSAGAVRGLAGEMLLLDAPQSPPLYSSTGAD